MKNKTNQSFMAIIAFAITLIGMATPSFATTRTWNGGAGTSTFLTSANWGATGAPVAGDDVIFAGTTQLSVVVTTSISLKSITFASGAGSFAISGAAILTLTSTTADIVNNSGVNQSIANGFTQNAVQMFVNTGTAGIITFSGEFATSQAKW